ncbi:MAG: uroporphyrinogen decarboxylase family protein [Phycisphaerae bacterium]|nr:uroporphyrinogen decarboxylase family protein [Phycisphaerae bacterium]
MRLIDWVHGSPRRLAVPLAGYPGTQLTGSSVKQNEFNAELQARSLYKLVERTAPDAVFTMMDLSVEAGALGLPVRFPLADSATVEWHPVRNVADLGQYKGVDPLYDGRVWVFLETVRILKRRLAIPIGVYVIGPFTLAGLMMGANAIALATIEKPDLVHATCNFSERVVTAYARGLQDAGADMICILDPTCVMLSPDAYATFCGPPVESAIRQVASPIILHICGNSTHLIEAMCSTGAQGISVGNLVPIVDIAPRVPSETVIFGNVSPIDTLRNGTPQEVIAETTELLEAMRSCDNFVPATGCDLPAGTPLENIKAFVDAVKAFAL